MARAEEVVIGSTCQQQIDQVFGEVVGCNGGTQDAFGSRCLTILNEETEPLFELSFVGELRVRQRTQHAAWWASKGITSTVYEGMYVGQSSIVFLQIWYEQTHTCEDGQPHREATLAETQSMHRPGTEYITVRDFIGTQACHCFCHEEGVAFLHTLAQITQELFS